MRSISFSTQYHSSSMSSQSILQSNFHRHCSPCPVNNKISSWYRLQNHVPVYCTQIIIPNQNTMQTLKNTTSASKNGGGKLIFQHVQCMDFANLHTDQSTYAIRTLKCISDGLIKTYFQREIHLTSCLANDSCQAIFEPFNAKRPISRTWFTLRQGIHHSNKT